VEEIVTTRPERCGHHRERRAGDVDRAEEGGLDLRQEHVDPAEPVNRSRHGRLCVRRIGDIQLHCQKVVRLPDRRADLLGFRPVATIA
jgi:hypothetical protein